MPNSDAEGRTRAPISASQRDFLHLPSGSLYVAGFAAGGQVPLHGGEPPHPPKPGPRAEPSSAATGLTPTGKSTRTF